MSMGIQVHCSDDSVGDAYAQDLFYELEALQSLEADNKCGLASMIAIMDEPEMYPAAEVISEIEKAKAIFTSSDAPQLMSKDAALSDLDEVLADLTTAQGKGLEVGLIAS